MALQDDDDNHDHHNHNHNHHHHHHHHHNGDHHNNHNVSKGSAVDASDSRRSLRLRPICPPAFLVRTREHPAVAMPRACVLKY